MEVSTILINEVYICNNVQYSPDRGIYEDTPKTERSKRYIALPVETMQLLRQYRTWQSGEMLRLGEYYRRQGFVFSQDNGAPMHPDSVSISKRLGHAQVSTTANIYAHVMEAADKKDADILADVFLKKA